MELQFEKKICRYLDRVVREVQAEEQTQEIRLTDGMPDVGRVIGAWGQVIVRGKEWRGDSIALSGGIMAWVLYAPEDGTEARCMDTWLPFKMKWDLPDGAKEGDIRVSCLLRGVDARSISPRKILVRACVAAQAEAFSPGEAEVYMPGKESGGVELLRRTYPVRMAREAGEKTFSLDEELTLSGPKPQRIVYCSLQPQVTDRKVLADKVVFRGTGNLHLLYKSEEGTLHAWDHELPFSQFAELRGEYGPDGGADVLMCVTSLETELAEEGQLRVKCGLVGQYLVNDREMLELVEDAYSPGRELSVQSRELELPVMLESRTETVYGEQKIPMDAGSVVDCLFLPDHPRQRRSDSGVSLELPGVFQVLALGENGELKAAAARWEGDMSLQADEDSQVEADILLQGRPMASPGDGSVSVSVEVPIKLETFTRQGRSQVAGLELGEAKMPDPARPSLILRRAGEDDLWMLAKSCGSTVDAIRKANSLQDEPAPDRLLLIPVS